MSRCVGEDSSRMGRFPRVSGDEPETMAFPFNFHAFSPRERG